MDPNSTASSFFRWPSPLPQTAIAVTATAVATTTLLLLARSALWPRWGKALPNPLKTTIPGLPKEEIEGLVYQPDAFPGARDVDTPVSDFFSFFSLCV
jgi:hypothetical protein